MEPRHVNTHICVHIVCVWRMCASHSKERIWCLYSHAHGPAIWVTLWNAFPIGDGVLPLVLFLLLGGCKNILGSFLSTWQSMETFVSKLEVAKDGSPMHYGMREPVPSPFWVVTEISWLRNDWYVWQYKYMFMFFLWCFTCRFSFLLFFKLKSNIWPITFLSFRYAPSAIGLSSHKIHFVSYTSPTYGCFLKWWYPQNTPKWSFLVGKPILVGYHHFWKPPYSNGKTLANFGRCPLPKVMMRYLHSFPSNLSPSG